MLNPQAYLDFLQSKVPDAGRDIAGDIDPTQIHASTFPHQRDAILWALRQQCALLAMSFGLGKTQIESEIARLLVAAHPGAKFLLVCPLGVRHQFIAADGPRLGIDWQYVYSDATLAAAETPFVVTNYERLRDGNITPANHNICGVALDEGSVMRSLGSKTVDVFLRIFKHIPFRFVATATPAPNSYREIIYYADFLGVMDHGQALTRWFKRNPEKAGDLQIHPQHERDFWLWVSTWALFLYKPSDMGFSDVGYDLPPLNVHWHMLTIDHARAQNYFDNRGQRKLLVDAAGSVTQLAQEKRATLPARVFEMMEIASKYLGLQIANQETLDGKDATGTQQNILRSKQGEGESAQPGLLSSEQGQDRPREEERVHAGISEDVPAPQVDAGRAGGAQSATPGAVRKRRGASGAPKAQIDRKQPSASTDETCGKAEGELRHHDSAVRADAESTGRSLRDLREVGQSGEASEAAQILLRRSRPQNGTGEGPALPQLQLRAGVLSGRPGAPVESIAVSQQLIVWCTLNDEQRAIEAALTNAGISFTSIFGALAPEESERRLFEWQDKKTCVLIGKASMLGMGCNLQHNTAFNIFLGIDYKFEDFIQAIHRTQRFQQQHAVDVHIIYAESEEPVAAALKSKWEQHDRLVETMRGIIREFGLDHRAVNESLKRHIGVARQEVGSSRFRAVNNDCVLEVSAMPDNSVGLIHTSIPFGNHYEYTTNYEDFGHNTDNDRFFAQMDFLIPELLRVLKPGRVAAIHVKDRQLYGHQTASGIMETDPFSDLTVAAFRKHGFTYQGRRTIVTDVVRENNSTYRLGWTEMTRDASKMSSGLPEYLLLFRKPPTLRDTARADEPVTRAKEDYSRGRWQIDAHAFWRSDGDVIMPTDTEERARFLLGLINAKEPYIYADHVARLEELDRKGQLPASFFLEPPRSKSQMVWDDVVFMRCLNSSQSRRNQTNHICPLPLDIVERTINLYSNPADVVLDPFGGLGTVAYVAIRLGRFGLTVELSPNYYQDSVVYLKQMEDQVTAPTLFDMLEGEGQTA